MSIRLLMCNVVQWSSWKLPVRAIQKSKMRKKNKESKYKEGQIGELLKKYSPNERDYATHCLVLNTFVKHILYLKNRTLQMDIYLMGTNHFWQLIYLKIYQINFWVILVQSTRTSWKYIISNISYHSKLKSYNP